MSNKILIVGSDKIFAIENFYVKYLRELGCEVFHFSAQSIFFDYYQKSIFKKLIFKSGLSSIYNKINKEFVNSVTNFQPDVIWIFKGMEIYPETLLWAKSKMIKLVNYNPDNPFLFSGKGSGNKNVTKSIPLYDLHLTYNSSVKNTLERKYKLRCNILPFGYDINEELYNKCCLQKEILKVCFLGNPDKYRAKFTMELAKYGVKIDVYGSSWKKFVVHENITILDHVYGEQFWLTLYKYRIQLNLMRPHNPDTHNMRSFEVGGVGGIQLAPETNDHKVYFEPEKEIFLFSNIEECLHQINKLLSLTAAEAKAIRINSRKRSISSFYSYRDRSKQALSFIKA